MLRDNSFKSKGTERELLVVGDLVRKYTLKNSETRFEYGSKSTCYKKGANALCGSKCYIAILRT